jgi:Flp pilus assembly protein TadD
MRKLLLLALLLLVPFQNLARAENPDEEAVSIINKAGKAAGDPAELRKLLSQIDEIVERAPSSPKPHFVRGYLRSRLGDKEGAIAAYRKTIELDPGMSAAHYNLGTVLTSAGREEEGIAEFNTAFRLDPKNADAAYNAAQGLYLLGRFEDALANWKAVKALAPNDFQTERKILQTLNALGRDAEAAAEFCFDQFIVDGRRVFAYEAFDLSAGSPIYLFKVNNSANRPIGTFDFVSAPDGGFLLRMVLPIGDSTTRQFSKRPTWRELKPAVEVFTRERFAGKKQSKPRTRDFEALGTGVDFFVRSCIRSFYG